MRLPKGFKRHRGGDCPVDPEQYVEMLILTSQGLGSSGVMEARFHQWEHGKHEQGLGAVVGYRLARRGEVRTFEAHHRIAVPDDHGLVATS